MRMWWYMAGEDRKGPISRIELEALFAAGDVSETTLVWCEGLSDWQQVGAIDEADLPAVKSKPVLSPTEEQPIEVSAPAAEFQGLTGTIDIVETEAAVVAQKQAVVEQILEQTVIVEPVLEQVVVAEPIAPEITEPAVATVAAIALEQNSLKQNSLNQNRIIKISEPHNRVSQEVVPQMIVREKAVVSNAMIDRVEQDPLPASFLEVARRGKVQTKKITKIAEVAPLAVVDTLNEKLNGQFDRSLIPTDKVASEKSSEANAVLERLVSARNIIAGVMGLLSVIALGFLFFSWSGSTQKLSSWTNPKTFNQVALDPQWSVTTSVNADQQIFYRFTHDKEPLIVRFGHEQFSEKTTLQDYSELLSLALEHEIYLESRGVEDLMQGEKTLTFAGHLVKDKNQKISVTFVKSGKQIWRTLVINTSGGRAKTKSYQILRHKLIDSLL